MPYYVTEHALLYTGGGIGTRTSLKAYDLKRLMDADVFVCFGFTRNTHFNLVWDHVEGVPIVVLTGTSGIIDDRVVISIWNIDFDLPVSAPKHEQVELAKKKSDEYWSRMALQE